MEWIFGALILAASVVAAALCVYSWVLIRRPMLSESPARRSLFTVGQVILSLSVFAYVIGYVGWAFRLAPEFSGANPWSIRVIDAGFFAAVGGLVCGLAGQGRSRLAVVGSSSMMILLWVLTAMGSAAA